MNGHRYETEEEALGANLVGWTGESCGNCGATHNIARWMAGGLMGPPGFFCGRCGSYNVLSFSHHQSVHESPAFGNDQTFTARIMAEAAHAVP